MKTILSAAVLAASFGGLAMADPVEGTWRTQKGETGASANVQVAACGSKICGTIIQVFGTDNTDNIGKKIIWDMSSKGNGKYSGGKIFAPDNGKTYNSKMALTGNKLSVSGCVLGICRSQNWTRVK